VCRSSDLARCNLVPNARRMRLRACAACPFFLWCIGGARVGPDNGAFVEMKSLSLGSGGAPARDLISQNEVLLGSYDPSVRMK